MAKLRPYEESRLKQLLAEFELLRSSIRVEEPGETSTPNQQEESRGKAALSLGKKVSDAVSSGQATWDDLQLLEKVLLELEAGPELKRRALFVRSEYKRTAGEKAYREYKLSFDEKSFDHNDVEAIRTDLLALQAETERLRAIEREHDRIRSASVNWALVCVGFFVLLWVLALAAVSNGVTGKPGQENPEPLAACIVFGSLGGLLSLVLRVRAEKKNGLEQPERLPIWTAVLGPGLGALAAVILYMLFRSGLISGSLFPNFDMKDEKLDLATLNGPNLAKLEAWAFIAGLFDQFVPDILARLGRKASEKLRLTGKTEGQNQINGD